MGSPKFTTRVQERPSTLCNSLAEGTTLCNSLAEGAALCNTVTKCGGIESGEDPKKTHFGTASGGDHQNLPEPEILWVPAMGELKAMLSIRTMHY